MLEIGTENTPGEIFKIDSLVGFEQDDDLFGKIRRVIKPIDFSVIHIDEYILNGGNPYFYAPVKYLSFILKEYYKDKDFDWNKSMAMTIIETNPESKSLLMWSITEEC